MMATGFLLSIFMGLCPSSSFAQEWYYPMDRYEERITIKDFGMLIDDDFYKGKEHLFPYNTFYGYHAAVDLEVFSEEKNESVPVYAVAKGKITFVGHIQGYGGVIRQEVDGGNRTALYGHVKITGFSPHASDIVNAGEMIGYLGDEFSDQTSQERKHLHFGIYKGKDYSFHGHETSEKILTENWENPTIYLKEKGAVSPVASQVTTVPVVQEKSTPLPLIIEWIKSIFYALLRI